MYWSVVPTEAHKDIVNWRLAIEVVNAGLLTRADALVEILDYDPDKAQALASRASRPPSHA